MVDSLFLSPVSGGVTDRDFIYSYAVDEKGGMRLEWSEGELAKAILPDTGDINKGGIWSDIIHPDDLGDLEDRIQDFKLGRARVDVFRINDREGTSRTVRAFSRVELSADTSRVVRIVGSVQDITTQHAAVQNLKTSEAMLRSVFEAANIGISLIEPDGYKRVRVNRAFCEMLGRTEDDLLTGPFTRQTHPDDVDRTINFRQKLCAGEADNIHYEERLLHADGRTVWGEVSETLIYDEAGKKHNIVSFIRDISKQKIAEKAEQASEAKYRSLVDGSLQGILIINANRKIRFANKALAHMFGYDSVEEIMDLDSSEMLLAPYELERLTAIKNARMAEEDVPAYLVFDGLRKDGKVIRIQSITHKFIWDGEPVIQSAYLDVSEQQRVEKELRQAKEEAEFASRAKTEFLANMSHELRTPLNSIIGFSDLMKGDYIKDNEIERYKSYASDINYSGRHLLELINDILDVSKIEAGALDVADEAVNVADTVNSSIRMVRDRAEKNEIRLNVSIPENLPQIHGDSIRVKQILLNLISNAIKFTEPGGSVDVSAKEMGGGFVLIAVSDTGIGIAEDAMEKIFKPFVQASTSPQLASEGTGLGLTLVKTLAEMMKGFVEMESELGKGTLVKVALPKFKPSPPPA